MTIKFLIGASLLISFDVAAARVKREIESSVAAIPHSGLEGLELSHPYPGGYEAGPNLVGGIGGGHYGPSYTAIEIEKHIEVPVYKQVPVPVPQPYPVPVPHPVPVKVPHPITVNIPVPVHVEKVVHVPIEKPVPYPVEKPYPVEVIKKIPYPVPKPYPVPVPIYRTKHVYHGHKHHHH